MDRQHPDATTFPASRPSEVTTLEKSRKYERDEHAVRFLEHLTQGESVTFQTFDDTTAKRKQLSKIMHGKLDKINDRIEELNQKGAGVFVMVNAGDLKGRRKTNVRRVRAVFVDLDGAPLEPVLKGPLSPHIIVESSPRRYHAYWRIDDLPLNEFRAAQEMLVLRFNSDPAVKDLPRVMRLPGFMHQKHEPYLTRLLETNSTACYHRSDLVDTFGFDPSVTDWRNTDAIPEGRRNNTLFSMALGYVRRAYSPDEIATRLCKTNEKRCNPPLTVKEVKNIAERAYGYGSSGTVNFDYSLIDSIFQKLSPGAVKLDMVARRIANDSNEVPFSLLKQDMAKWGFGNPKTLAKYRDELIANNLLKLHRPPRYGQVGDRRECGLYRIAVPEFYGKSCHK
jgi:RepB DNA-primase N-terminal domain/Primase C terminal 1 (PriCT-1)